MFLESMNDANSSNSHRSQEEIYGTSQESFTGQRPADNRPDQGYLPDNVEEHLPDSDDDSRSDICLGYGWRPYGNRIDVVNSKTWILTTSRDGSEAV
jgi:hypothetical protein